MTPQQKALQDAIEALELCFDHCRLWHPEANTNNVGQAVRAAITQAKQALSDMEQAKGLTPEQTWHLIGELQQKALIAKFAHPQASEPQAQGEAFHVEHRTNAHSEICNKKGGTYAVCSWGTDAAARAEHICALLNGTHPQASEPAWRPIETAPKDGRKIIVTYSNRNGRKRTVMACWVTDEAAAETDADDVGLEAGWFESIDNWNDYTEVAIHEGEPTHWMPLPTPPEAK